MFQTHTSKLYGQISIEEIMMQFPVWKNYFQRFLPQDNNAKVLDIGCGNGGFVHFLHETGYASAEGVDVSEEQVELSQRLQIKGITCSDLSAYLADKQEVFDAVFARDVIEHFYKDEVLDIFSVVHRALKPGEGYLSFRFQMVKVLWLAGFDMVISAMNCALLKVA